MSKVIDYAQLVAVRKACHLCSELTNPSDIEGGRFDSEHIGAWSSWQGNLNASIMVVGQDWGDKTYFVQHEGRSNSLNPTNMALVKLLRIAGISIGSPDSSIGHDIAFFTNAILCLKGSESGPQGKIQSSWLSNCSWFLRRQIEIIRPTVVVGLGEYAYRMILRGFEMKCGPFRPEVEATDGRSLPMGIRVFAVYHCGTKGLNLNRTMNDQEKDWKRIRPFVITASSHTPAYRIAAKKN